MMEKIYAYAWFRRPHSVSPGNWTHCHAGQMASLVKQLRRNHIDDPGAGNILRGSTLNSRYDYIYVKIEVPSSAIEGLEEV